MKRLFALVLSLTLLCPTCRAASAPVTRGEFTVSLWDAFGGVPYEDTGVFYDVSHNRPDTAAICWAADMGFLLGTGWGRFDPDRPITREEAAMVLRRVGNFLGFETRTFGNLAECNDFDGISPWADDSLYWATDTGLILWAEGGLMAPQGTLTTEEVSGIFTRFFL